MNGIASRLAEPEERTSTGSSAGQGSNSAVLRGYNERVILAALRRLGEASKAEPARHAGLTQNATGQIVRELERQWIEDCAGALLNPVLSIACLLDVQSIVIGGDLPGTLVERLAAKLRDMLARAMRKARAPPTTLVGTVGRDAAAMGAAILPLHLNHSPAYQILFGHSPNH